MNDRFQPSCVIEFDIARDLRNANGKPRAVNIRLLDDASPAKLHFIAQNNSSAWLA